MSILETVIRWLAPPECIGCGQENSALCLECSAAIVPFGDRCWRCDKLSPGSVTCESCKHIGSPGRTWIVTNYEGPARALLSLYKFGHQRSAAESVSRLMTDRFMDSANLAQRDYLIVPVPTATRRIRERGFDHIDLLAKIIAAKLALRIDRSLRRLGQTRQLGARREDRLAQLASSFVVKNPTIINGRNILLVDDVITTGGTVIAAAKTLRAAGAKSVDALIFAKKL